MAAARAAAHCGCPITLLSAQDAAAAAGPGWFAEVAAAARDAAPGADLRAILDCGDRAGDAMAAIRSGVTHLCFRGPDDIARKLEQMGAVLRDEPDEVLDLLDAGDAEAACRRWLDPGQ
ncbi:MAG: hypothetical protein QNJ94_21570 [Alphaproteobacteria bacterium]|nr:hypothetical protein [Alphaproteobacteria bacterium]